MHLTRKTIVQALAVMLMVFVVLYLARIAGDSATISNLVAQYGYPALFLLSIIGGFNVFVPIPTPSFVPLFVESGLNFWATVAVMTLGLTIADFIGFLIGRVGRNITREWRHARIIKRLEALCERNFWFPLVFLSVYVIIVPLPNELVVIPMAFIGYRMTHLIAPLLVGNALFLTWTSIGFISIVNLL